MSDPSQESDSKLPQEGRAEVNAAVPGDATVTASSPASPSAPDGKGDGVSGGSGPGFSFSAEPTTKTGWVKPRYAVWVVLIIAVSLLGVLVGAVLALGWGSADGSKTANANASTISAIAAATIAALSSLSAAYFGIRVATEQSAQSAQTARDAVRLLGASTPNSTVNGNPKPGDF